MLAKPLIAEQIETLQRYVEQVLLNPYGNAKMGLAASGPPGCGKSYAFRRAFQTAGKPYVLITTATFVGVVEKLMQHPVNGKTRRIYYAEDYNGWQTDLHLIDFLKNALDSSGPRRMEPLKHRGQNSLFRPVVFDGKFFASSNTDPATLPPSVRIHNEALADRLVTYTISYDAAEMLKFLDWMICEQDYLKSPEFKKATNSHHLRISLQQTDDILQFLHDSARLVRPSMRLLIDAAIQRLFHAVDSNRQLLLSDNGEPQWREDILTRQRHRQTEATFWPRNTPVPPKPVFIKRSERHAPPPTPIEAARLRHDRLTARLNDINNERETVMHEIDTLKFEIDDLERPPAPPVTAEPQAETEKIDELVYVAADTVAADTPPDYAREPAPVKRRTVTNHAGRRATIDRQNAKKREMRAQKTIFNP